MLWRLEIGLKGQAVVLFVLAITRILAERFYCNAHL